MSVIHIVLFKLSQSLDEDGIKQFHDEMVSLKDKCVHPQTKKPYTVSSSGGTNNSPEGLAGGFTHGYVVEFASAEDRDYYVAHDPAHQAFVKGINGKFDDLRVFDYTKGVH